MSRTFDYFKIPDSGDVPEPASSSDAKKIIDLFKSGKDETRIFLEDGIPRHKIEGAKKEWLRLKEEVYKRISGGYVTKEAVPPVLDEEGNIITPGVPAEYYTPTTKTDMQNQLSSSTLFVAKDVVDDILAYDEKSPWSPLTFTQLKEKYYQVQMAP